MGKIALNWSRLSEVAQEEPFGLAFAMAVVMLWDSLDESGRQEIACVPEWSSFFCSTKREAKTTLRQIPITLLCRVTRNRVDGLEGLGIPFLRYDIEFSLPDQMPTLREYIGASRPGQRVRIRRQTYVNVYSYGDNRTKHPDPGIVVFLVPKYYVLGDYEDLIAYPHFFD